MEAVTRTYPPEVAEQRAQIMQMIDDVKARYEEKARPPVDATATQIAAIFYRDPAERLSALHREYLAEINPLVKLLVSTEAFATITIRIPA